MRTQDVPARDVPAREAPGRDAPGRDAPANDTKAILRRALAGESLILDRLTCSLHELTQIAVALRENANLAIRNADLMTPIERASVESAGRGRIVFL